MQRLQRTMPHTKTGSVKQFMTRLFATFVSCVLMWVGSIDGASAATSEAYIAPDGSDLTAVAECLPSQLSEGNLDRALRESGNDFLEKVFNTKSNYDEYALEDSEVEFLACLKRNGVTPQVQKVKS